MINVYISRFHRGDRVVVTSNCQTHNCKGMVISNPHKSWTSCTYAKVRLDDGCVRTYNELSLKLVSNTNINQNETEKENREMGVKGNYRVAMVKFIQGTNMYKEYAFALFDDTVQVEDYVLCDTAQGQNVAKVVNILSQTDYNGCTVTKEVICKVDYSAFEERKEKRKQRENLEKQMDKMVVNNQKMILYQAIADKNPVMAELLEQYKALGDV